MRAGPAWDAAPFDELAAAAAPIHDALVGLLAPGPRERFLDVATGTGPVALRAARRGALVTALDVAPGMLAGARRAFAAERLPVRAVLADAHELPFLDAEFDVVASAQGVVFCADAGAAAAELARVCRPGGRLGLSCPARRGPNVELFAAVGGAALAALEWGRRSDLERLLGGAFELEVEEQDFPLLASSPEALWELHLRACGPVALLARAGPPAALERLRAELVALFARYAGTGGVALPRPVLLVRGVRRRAASRRRRGAG